MPRPKPLVLSKVELLDFLVRVDRDEASSARVLAMETELRRRIIRHLEALSSTHAKFAKLNTNPFVLMIYAFQNRFCRIGEIETLIMPAKIFSSMETSAGRMIEAVVLPTYGWEVVESSMHSQDSAIDGRKKVGDVVRLATLKSGPRCLNDEMSENLADAIFLNCEAWAAHAGVRKVDFTYGVLYGTKKQSNKKDWHILRKLVEKLSSGIDEGPDGSWHCRFTKNEIEVAVTIRIGIDLWSHIAAHDLAFMEICVALLRACVVPADLEQSERSYSISDLANIVSLEGISARFNTKILQRSQLEWLFFFARHFCDALVAGDLDSLTDGARPGSSLLG
ncbi:MAG: hypothetical protein HC897_08455 [Thermoanaerobaculia bacterium]|nr:hypothetical protein [Thermoanaerobaculia bacterium]